MSQIASYLPETEILAQLAEECAELAQAALKLRRALDTTNPTPVPEDECREHLCEEIADVRVCVDALFPPIDEKRRKDFNAAVSLFRAQKESRWKERLEARG